MSNKWNNLILKTYQIIYFIGWNGMKVWWMKRNGKRWNRVESEVVWLRWKRV